MSRRKYSDVQKAEAIAVVKSNGGNIFRSAHELGIPWATLSDWVKGDHGINPGVTELQEEKEEALAIICERIARKYMAQAENPYCIAATPGNLAMTTAAIAIDKNRLLLEQPTSITKTHSPAQSLVQMLKELGKGDITEEQAEKIMAASIQRAGSKLKAVS